MFVIASLLASLAFAQDYQRFEESMAVFKFTWDAVKVTTEDGFILTTFHVTGNENGAFEPDKPPVIL
jgi:pimeloyl-ACP methyl ester carboxylesterase